MARVLYYLGGAFRETGQALDRVGLTFASNPAFKEQCKAHFDPITAFVASTRTAFAFPCLCFS